MAAIQYPYHSNVSAILRGRSKLPLPLAKLSSAQNIGCASHHLKAIRYICYSGLTHKISTKGQEEAQEEDEEDTDDGDKGVAPLTGSSPSARPFQWLGRFGPLPPRQNGDIRDIILMSLAFAVYVYISQQLVCAYCVWQSMSKHF